MEDIDEVEEKFELVCEDCGEEIKNNRWIIENGLILCHRCQIVDI